MCLSSSEGTLLFSHLVICGLTFYFFICFRIRSRLLMATLCYSDYQRIYVLPKIGVARLVAYNNCVQRHVIFNVMKQ